MGADQDGGVPVALSTDGVQNPLSCDLDRLKDIRIEQTFLGGRQVFGPILREEIALKTQ
jgi:hypothetical protein